VVLNSRLEEEQRDKSLEKVEEWAKGAGAEEIKRSHFGIKDLVYKMKNEDRGDFWILDLVAPKPMNFKEYNLFLNRDANIIRYLVLKQE
jgi:ribosomal protein S6